MKLKENINIELKREYTNEIKKEVVAFLNTCDGTIYIGVEDNGKVVGLENPNHILNIVSTSLINSIKPDISMYIESSLIKIEGKDILSIKVQRGASRPYYIAEKGLKPNGVYIRQGSSSIPSSEEYIRETIKETDGNSYEKLRSLEQNLTFDYTNKIFKESEINFEDSQKKTLGLLTEDNIYTNLALLLSDQCKHTLKIAVFEGLEKEIFKDRKEFTGSLLKQINESFSFIDLLNKKTANFEGLIRKDVRDYPVEAIREALLNAVVHREYSFGGSTLINIYEDRIEFISLGGIVYGLSLESIFLGVSQPRNEKLANVFYRLHLIEAYGTGIQKIFLAYKNSSLKPKIQAEKGVFLVILPNIHYKKTDIKYNIENSIHKEIISFLEEHKSASRKELENHLKLSQTRVITLLKELLELNLIEKSREGRIINYRLK